VATSIYRASAPEAEGVTGQFFANRKPKTSSKASYNTAATTRLWQISADLAVYRVRTRRGSVACGLSE
jgi:retinol dehydrogenase-14